MFHIHPKTGPVIAVTVEAGVAACAPMGRQSGGRQSDGSSSSLYSLFDFADVLPASQRWQSAGKAIYIFSSGSVQAQQLIFRYREAGDLTPYISGYFDTTIGSKRKIESYQKIAEEVRRSPAKILFISDVTVELQPAKTVGFQTLFSSRPGNPLASAEGFTQIENFDSV